MTKTSDDLPAEVPGREATACLRPLAIALIWASTALPVDVSFSRFNERIWRSGPADILINVILYVPLGIALRRTAWWKALGTAAALSVFVECLQLFYPDRFTAITDVAANVAGTLLGYGLFAFVDRPRALGIDPFELTRRIAIVSILLCAIAVALLSYSSLPSDFSNWDPECRVIAGDELTQDRRWQGDIDVVAVFDRCLDRGQIERLSVLDAGTDLGDALGRLSPLFLERLAGRLDAVRGVPLMDEDGNERFYQRLLRSGRLSLIVGCRPMREEQYGPARIFGFSKSPWAQNFSLGQERRDVVFRLRTPTTLPGGFFPQTKTRAVLEKGRVTVVAATYDGHNVRVYVDGRHEERLNLRARGKLSPYVADTGLPAAAAVLGALAGVPWVVAAGCGKRPNLAFWGAVGGLAGGLALVSAGGSDALPEFKRWVPIVAGWGGAVMGGSVVVGSLKIDSEPKGSC